MVGARISIAVSLGEEGDRVVVGGGGGGETPGGDAEAVAFVGDGMGKVFDRVGAFTVVVVVVRVEREGDLGAVGGC